MPGLLVDGRAARPEGAGGERLAVIEAMKMENILFAADGVVGKIGVGQGASRWRDVGIQ